MLKRLLILALLTMAAVPAMAQTSFYTDRALQQVNVLTSPTPLTAAIPYGPVRVCSLPLTQASPCLPLATITDVNGNAISNAIGANFGQLTTDATGRFTFGCTNNVTYQVQVTQSASNTPAVNYPITCPGGVGASVSANNTFSATQTFTGSINCTIVNAVRCVSSTNPQGWTGSDLGAQINSAFAGTGTNTFSNCNTTGACEVDVADGTYTVSTTIAPTGPNLFLKFGLVTITYNSKLLDISAANGFHLKGAGGGFLQSAGYPDTGAKATKFLCGTATATDGILANPGTNVILGGIILEDFAIVGCGAGATSGSNIHFNAIQAGGNIASVRDFSIHGVYSINAKGNGLQMTGAVFCPSNFCVSFSQFNFNQASNILLEAGTSTVFASQIRLTNVDTEASVNGWGREFEPSFTDVYDNNGTVQGNALGGSLCSGGQCHFTNYHSEAQPVVDIKFLNTAVGGSVKDSSLGGNGGAPTGKGVWITGSSAGLNIGPDNTFSGHAALSDIVFDATVSNTQILDPPTVYTLTDSSKPFNVYFPNGFTKLGLTRSIVSLVNGLNSNIATPGSGASSFFQVNGPTGAFSIGGFTGGVDGKILRVENATTQPMTIVNLDASSTATNRIFTLTGANVVLAAQNSFADFIYENADNLWLLTSTNIGDQPVGAAMTQALTNKTLNTPFTNGTGLQFFNTATSCTTAATAFVTCTTANITLPVTEPDTAYRISCTPHAATNFPVLVSTTIVDTSHFTITIEATTAAAATFASYDCFVGHN